MVVAKLRKPQRLGESSGMARRNWDRFADLRFDLGGGLSRWTGQAGTNLSVQEVGRDWKRGFLQFCNYQTQAWM